MLIAPSASCQRKYPNGRGTALADFAMFEIQNCRLALLGALLLQQISEWAEIEIQVGRAQAKVVGQFVNLGFEFHEGCAHLLDLLLGERASLHPADGLSLKQLTYQFDQSQHQLGQALLDVLWRTLDAATGCDSEGFRWATHVRVL